MMEITVSEWLAELERVQDSSPDGLSIAELVERTGRSRKSLRGAMKRAQRAGKLRVARRRETGLDGRTQWVPVYRIVEAR